MSGGSDQNDELYRRSSVGTALADTLDELVSQHRIEPQLAFKMMITFNKVAAEVLKEKNKARMKLKGHLEDYRFCEDVWTLWVKRVNLKVDNKSNDSISADKLKIVAFKSQEDHHTGHSKRSKKKILKCTAAGTSVGSRQSI